MSLVIALQFYAGDRDRAMRLARFIADLEPSFTYDLEMCFVARFDCPQHTETIEYVSRKMATSQFTTRRELVGWPEGPNGMAYDLFEQMKKWTDDDRWSHHDGVLLLEPDCVPLRRGWLLELMAVWHGARKMGAVVMGSWAPSGGKQGHINGNMIVDPHLDLTVLVAKATPQLAWDVEFAPLYCTNWHVTNLILNLFGQIHIPSAKLRESGAVLVHGIKDDSAWNYVRELGLP